MHAWKFWFCREGGPPSKLATYTTKAKTAKFVGSLRRAPRWFGIIKFNSHCTGIREILLEIKLREFFPAEPGRIFDRGLRYGERTSLNFSVFIKRRMDTIQKFREKNSTSSIWLNFKIPKCMVAHTKYIVQTQTSNADCARTTHPHQNLRPVLDSAWNQGPRTC